MTYRDEEGAQAARVDALQDEVEVLREENEKLKEAVKAAPPPKTAKAAQALTAAAAPAPAAATSYDARKMSESRRFTIVTVVGTLIMLPLGLAPSLLLGHNATPSFGLGAPSMIALLIGGATVSANFMRIVLPAVPIMAKDENGTYTVERSMKVRKILFALSAAAYLLGSIGWFLATAKT